jgi:hypothetical protein
MPDNKLIKDGMGNIFTLRMRDISPQGDGSVQRSMFYATPYPVDYGVGGVYQHVAKSGSMAGSLPALSTIYSFQWAATSMVAAITSVRMMAWSTTTPFASAGPGTFDFYVARNFTVADTGGTSVNLAGDTNQLRTSMAASQAIIEVSNTGGLNPGTRTLDSAPLYTQMLQIPTTAGTIFTQGSIPVFEKAQGDHPLVLAANEGFVVLASIPSIGTWQFNITTMWAEAANY